MRFGEVLNKYRELAGLSINQLGKEASITPTYISRIQNNPDKLPSKKVLLKLASVLKLVEETHNPIYLEELLYAYCEEKGLSEEEFQKLNYEFYMFMNERIDSTKEELKETKDKIFKNQFVINRTNQSFLYLKNSETLQEISNYPLFDLKWLLTQKKYEVFFGRNIELNEKKGFYNVLKEEDVHIIYKLIEGYLHAKYNGVKEPKNFFEHHFDELVDDNLTSIMTDITEEDIKFTNDKEKYVDNVLEEMGSIMNENNQLSDKLLSVMEDVDKNNNKNKKDKINSNEEE
ncbi:helix-turn-helix domain-containing protein [Staphylococcus arlettae]|uniref:helix-turn-helix domain-containing protein n=1 Tax=Staphylococcus arlettae TaxID=29378 RepID=UPI0021D3D07B|nr:helix-turn-helix transcriptional regulator [Staphylococcus arlettae]UXU51435.1 helix-turn-helix domain-containing protein [Staphylococcus arlettae]